MTKFEKIVEGGPELLADILTRSKIVFAETALESAGLEYEFLDDGYERLFKEHYKFLTSEHVEKGE